MKPDQQTSSSPSPFPKIHTQALTLLSTAEDLTKTLKEKDAVVDICIADLQDLKFDHEERLKGLDAAKEEVEGIVVRTQAVNGALKEREGQVEKYAEVVMEGLAELAGCGAESEEGYRVVLEKYAVIAGKILAAEARRVGGR